MKPVVPSGWWYDRYGNEHRPIYSDPDVPPGYAYFIRTDGVGFIVPTKEKRMTDQFKDVASRAAWTALQAFFAVFAITDLTTARSAAVAAIGAAISVAKTFIAQKVEARKAA